MLVTNDNVSIYGFSHPKGIFCLNLIFIEIYLDGIGLVEIGRFVSAIGVSRNKHQTSFPTKNLACQICQHIIGMNPTSLKESSATVTTTKVQQTNQTSNVKEFSESGALDNELNSLSLVEVNK